MIVYRVENEKGKGPYCPGWGYSQPARTRELYDLADALVDSHSGDPLRPVPTRDGIYNSDFEDMYNPRFGFMSIGELIQWFAGWFEWLEVYGYVIRCYYVDLRDVLVGQHQVVFEYDQARLLS